MQIIIVGCGKIGKSLATQLQSPDIDLTLIDTQEDAINEITEAVDAMGIVGNGASFNTLMEAGIETADVLIAVTEQDELNLLCCLIAQKSGHCQTIARVRNPLYSRELEFLKKRLGISMIINPELAAAREIFRLLRFPSAIKIDTFSKGRVELLKFKVKPEFQLGGKKVSQLAETFRCDILVCGVERGNTVTIPDGNFVIENEDSLTIIASPVNASAFFKKIGLKTNQVKNALLIGGGTISYYLAQFLLDMKIPVKIIESSKDRCEYLCENLPAATIIHGDETDRNLLLEEGLQRTESFVALSSSDEENVFLTLYAKTVCEGKMIAKVDDLSYDDVIENLDIGSVIYPKQITADTILQYIRAMKDSLNSNVETLYQILDNRAEALEFKITKESSVTGIPLSKLSLKKNLLVCSLNQNGDVRIPRGHDDMQVGDTVVIVTTNKGLDSIDDIIK